MAKCSTGQVYNVKLKKCVKREKEIPFDPKIHPQPSVAYGGGVRKVKEPSASGIKLKSLAHGRSLMKTSILKQKPLKLRRKKRKNK